MNCLLGVREFTGYWGEFMCLISITCAIVSHTWRLLPFYLRLLSLTALLPEIPEGGYVNLDYTY